MKIFLDDLRTARTDEWFVVRNAKEAISMIDWAISKGIEIEKISLDHDLGAGLSGYDVACHIEKLVVENPDFICPEIVIHSANPVGRYRIQQVINSINKTILKRELYAGDTNAGESIQKSAT